MARNGIVFYVKYADLLKFIKTKGKFDEKHTKGKIITMQRDIGELGKVRCDSHVII